MDLLLKNPKYFFQTYFNFSVKKLLIVFCAVLFLELVFFYLVHSSQMHESRKKLIPILVFDLYITAIIGITLLNQNRAGEFGIQINTFEKILTVIRESSTYSVHIVREILSNIILFIPLPCLLFARSASIRYYNVIIIGLIMSFAIETAQYLFRVGYSETSDIVMNVCGVIIGILFTCILKKYKTKW